VYGMSRIVIRKFGNINEEDIKKIISIMQECYERIEIKNVEMVDLYIFEKGFSMKEFKRGEKVEKLSSLSLEEEFFATHDAYHGIPRIMIAIDKLNELPENVRIGGIRHEVAHSILHGSLDYYIFSIPSILIEYSKKYSDLKKFFGDITYLISIAIKDYEVTNLLCKYGYIEDQYEYVKYFLKHSIEEKETWEIVKNNFSLTLLFIASLIKIIACAAPLLFTSFNKKISEDLGSYISYLPIKIQNIILKIVLKKFQKQYENLQQEINIVCEELIKNLEMLIA
jgi:hypothetical protein